MSHKLKVSEGDWICSNKDCGNINFSRRSSCNKCGQGKDTRSQVIKQTGAEIGKGLASKSKGLFSADDWQCGKCGNINWARRVTCNICNAAKFGAEEARTGIGGGYNERDNVEYFDREESDGEYDEFGRKKKKYRDHKVSDEKYNQKEKRQESEEEEDDDEGDASKYDLEQDEEEEEEDDVDLSKYDLSESEDDTKQNNAKESLKRGRKRSRSSSRSPKRRRSRSSSSSSSSSGSGSSSRSSSSSSSRSRSRSVSRSPSNRRRSRSRSPRRRDRSK